MLKDLGIVRPLTDGIECALAVFGILGFGCELLLPGRGHDLKRDNLGDCHKLGGGGKSASPSPTCDV